MKTPPTRGLHTRRAAGRGAQKPRSARKFPWSKEEDALLGKVTDREVAEKLNRTLAAVRDRRTHLGKAALGRAPQSFRMEREPRDGYGHLFASKSNKELRAILGWSYKRIHTRRRQLTSGKARKRYPDWTLEEDRLLGTKPDAQLARMFGRTVSAVRGRRGEKRIRVKRDWQPADDRLLGTRPDKQVALLLGRSLTNVRWRREKLGIAAKAIRRAWTREEEALLGTKPDRELALAFGRTVVAVEARRIELGRPKPDAVTKVVKRGSPGARYCTWTTEEDALLGKCTDEEVVRKLGYSVARVRRRRRLLGLWNPNAKHRHWTPEEIALLGTRPDREVAPLVNRSLENVRCKRLALRIPFHNARYEIWKPDEVALLGKLPDKEVAQRTGHSVESVRRARHRRGILSYGGS